MLGIWNLDKFDSWNQTFAVISIQELAIDFNWENRFPSQFAFLSQNTLMFALGFGSTVRSPTDQKNHKFQGKIEAAKNLELEIVLIGGQTNLPLMGGN